MSKEEQQQAKNHRAAQSLYEIYEILILQLRLEISQALHIRENLHGQITGLASSIFIDGNLQGMLIRYQHEWVTCIRPYIPCPLTFISEDKTQTQHLKRVGAKVLS